MSYWKKGATETKQQEQTQVVVMHQQQHQQKYKSGGKTKTTKTIDDNGSLMMKKLKYYNPRADTGNYEENMKPWEVDRQSYDFACYTNHGVQIEEKKSCCNRQKLSSNERWEISVYRKSGSNRLIIKKKDYESSLLNATKNPCMKWAIAVILLGVLFIVIGAASSGELAGIGAAIFCIGILMAWIFQRQKVQRQEFTMTSQSIPIKSIFYVERKVETFEEQDQCCCGCCAPDKDPEVHYSWISIGYSRSNLSTKFQSAASKEDYVSLQLISNQAYNLHQYVNAIIDGGNPEFNRD